MSLSRGCVLSIALLTCSMPVLSEVQLRPVPRASCGPEDRTESVQGQTTMAERFAPGPARAFNCNLELVGQFTGEGASFGYADFKQCAYYSAAPNPSLRNRGVTVLDVSDPSRPIPTVRLGSPVMLDAIETLEVNVAQGLLVGGSTEQTPSAKSPYMLEFYDIQGDCRRPVLRSTLALPNNMYAHTGQFTADGRTYYGAKWSPEPKLGPIAAVFAVSVENAASPQYLGAWVPPDQNWITHHVAPNADGTRAYVAIKRLQDDSVQSPHLNGLVVLDVSEVQARKAKPELRFISRLFWEDTHFGQFAVPATVGGKPYIISTDLAAALGIARPLSASACSSGKPNHGLARIIDLSDESRPKTLTRLMLEVHDPARCSQVMHDPTGFGGYGTAGCSVDDPRDAKLLACGYFEGGLRVFDIRNPVQPREVAYYKPPAQRTASRPASLLRFPGADFTADAVVVVPRFHREKQEIWFTSFDNGFQVVRFSERFRASHPDLF